MTINALKKRIFLWEMTDLYILRDTEDRLKLNQWKKRMIYLHSDRIG